MILKSANKIQDDKMFTILLEDAEQNDVFKDLRA